MKKGIIKNKDKYYYSDTNKKVCATDQERINKLRIPPAWTDVWVSNNSKSKLQAYGYDIKGKKQYIYHENHIKKSTKKKYDRLSNFIGNMYKLEKNIERDLKLKDYSRDNVIALMLFIMKNIHIRVGKECYVKMNKSYGLSSLRKKHMTLKDGKIIFKFKGKSNKQLVYKFKSETVFNMLKKLRTFPNDRLFQYKEDGEYKRLTYSDLNEYLKENMGEDFTCKDFRTYAANVSFVKYILSLNEIPKKKKDIKKNIKDAIEYTANLLKNTPSIAKKSYISHTIIQKYEKNPRFFKNNEDKEITEIIKMILK